MELEKGVVPVRAATLTPYTGSRRPRVHPLLVAVFALAAALVSVGAWALLDRGTSTSEGLASREIATMLETRIAAMNRGDSAAAATLYTRKGVMEERDQIPAVVSRGRDAIEGRLSDLYAYGMRLERVGAPIQVGRFVAEAVRLHEAGGPGAGEFVLVFEIGPGGKIAHQWVMGEARG